MAVPQPFSETVFAAGTAFATGANNGPDIDTSGCQYLSVYTKVTVPNGGSIVVTVQGKDPTSGDYYTLLAGASISTATTQRLKVGPTIAASANAIAQDYLPRTIRILVTGTTAIVTGSVGIEVTD